MGDLLTVGGSKDLDIAIDASGNAMAAGRYRGYLQISRLLGGGAAWAAAQTNLTSAQSRPSASAFRFDGRGGAHAVWPTEAGMQAAVYSERSGWSETSLVGDGKTSAVVVASENNTVLVAWASAIPSKDGVSGNRYTGQNWEEPR